MPFFLNRAGVASVCGNGFGAGLFQAVSIFVSYLILASTGGTIVSLVASTLVLWVAPKVVSNEHTWTRLILLVEYLGSIALGGLAGTIAGFMAARKLTQRLSWLHAR